MIYHENNNSSSYSFSIAFTSATRTLQYFACSDEEVRVVRYTFSGTQVELADRTLQIKWVDPV